MVKRFPVLPPLLLRLLLIGSFIMISLGIIGEYIAKIYEEVKARPHYLVKASVGVNRKSKSSVR